MFGLKPRASDLQRFCFAISTVIADCSSQVRIGLGRAKTHVNLELGTLGKYFTKALEEIDGHFCLDCSVLFLRDPENIETFLVAGTTSAKDTIFRHRRCGGGSQFLAEQVALDRPQPLQMERNRYRGDNLWELLWETLYFGPYAWPYEVLGLPLYQKKAGTPSQYEVAGLLVLAGTHESLKRLESGKYRDALAFVVEQFDNAANWITTAGTIQKLQELSTSEYMKKVASAAQRVLLHGILAPMQRMENAIHLTEKKMEVGKQKDASAHLRDARSEIPEAKRCVQTFLRMSLGGDAGDVTGLLTRPEEWTDAERVVAAVCENFSHQAQRKGVEFVIRTASIPKLPMREDDFELILANLVHNAVKYGYPNTKIKIQYEVKAPDVCIDVVSYGIPIAQNERERIFDLGYRTLLASRIEYAAAGIGLFAARQAALRWGGRLFVSGSDFEDKSQHGDRYRNTFRFVMKIQEKKP